MNMTPRYEFPVGTEVTLFEKKAVINGQTEEGYELTNVETGTTRVVPFQHFVDYLSLPGAKLDVQLPATGNRLQRRLGGYRSAKALPDRQQKTGRIRWALCEAMKLLRDKTREETGQLTFELSISKMNLRENRKFVKEVAEALLQQKIHLDGSRGGYQKGWKMCKGRTLMKHFREFMVLEPSESPLDALVPLDHHKGNRTPRISWRVKELMTSAWEEVGIDLKGPSPSNVMKYFKYLLHEENKRRERNDLPPLLCPAPSTLAAHRDELQTPTEFMIGSKGERHARNKRGRGSTDIRSLLIGEFVEIDECKGSLVVSAKIKGIWELLSQSEKAKLEEIDKEIRERLYILAMLDIATRMPLAWVISDQPKAEATLALFRMATRDKIREKRLYGCDADPMPAVGIGHVKNDNGPGLRNSRSIETLMGMGAMNTIARTYSSTDKPYVERMFGTQESVLLKLIHGYTGRKAGELPGYDAKENGVLDIDELYGILTRFMIDEYPSMPHMGVGMGGRRPLEVYKEIEKTRRHFPVMDPNMRRIHLGREEKVTPNDEGVRVFSGIWYNSNILQEKLEKSPRRCKVSVFVDPDDMTLATVLLPKVKEPIEVQIQITAFADMTLPEILNLMAIWRKEHPKVTEIHEDRLARVRRERHEQLRAIGVERRLPRSYSTVEECRAKAKAVFAGARTIRSGKPLGTAPVGNIAKLDQDVDWRLQIGSDDIVIEGTLTSRVQEDDQAGFAGPLGGGATSAPAPDPEVVSNSSSAAARKTEKATVKAPADKPLGRPKDVKGLE